MLSGSVFGGLYRSLSKVVAPGAQSLLFTPKCLNKLKSILLKRKQASPTDEKERALRVEVQAGGCSGFQYVFRMEDSFDDDDV
jgi:Fe-S cluster assembly iron-binding protein IscA